MYLHLASEDLDSSVVFYNFLKLTFIQNKKKQHFFNFQVILVLKNVMIIISLPVEAMVKPIGIHVTSKTQDV